MRDMRSCGQEQNKAINFPRKAFMHKKPITKLTIYR